MINDSGRHQVVAVNDQCLTEIWSSLVHKRLTSVQYITSNFYFEGSVVVTEAGLPSPPLVTERQSLIDIPHTSNQYPVDAMAFPLAVIYHFQTDTFARPVRPFLSSCTAGWAPNFAMILLTRSMNTAMLQCKPKVRFIPVFTLPSDFDQTMGDMSHSGLLTELPVFWARLTTLVHAILRAAVVVSTLSCEYSN